MAYGSALGRQLNKPAGNGCRGRSCDVLVIGAGPAGSSAARTAAAAGADVVIIERRQIVGRPPRCAGFIPQQLRGQLHISHNTVAQNIRRMLTHHPAGVEESNSLGYIVHRELFDQELTAAAVGTGAELLAGCRAAIRKGSRVVVTGGDFEAEVSAQVIIGADGPLSTVGRSIGVCNTSFALAAQWRVGLTQQLSDIHVYFDRQPAAGYGWLFPLGDKANIGIAVGRGATVRPAAALRKFAAVLAAEDLIEPGAEAATGGLIPVGGPLPCRTGAILLAGDAAGHCHPLTGAGIATAVQCGEMAGQAAAAAVSEGTDEPLRHYEEEVEEMFGEPLRRAAERRREFQSQGGLSSSEYDAALRRAWIAFPEYCYA